MPKNDYTVRKLIHSPSFRRMVKGKANADEISRWNKWIEANDKNRQKAKEAVVEIVGFEFRDPENLNIDKEWDRLYKATIQKNYTKLPESHHKNAGFQRIYRVAALLILGALIGTGIYVYSNDGQFASQEKQITQKKTIKTGSNEQQTVTFADGSKIILNHNSKMSYQLGVLHHQPIKVTLEGEAYFEAASDHHGKNNPEFAVYTPDGIIRDLGTKFLVTVRKNRSTVVLQAGEVEVHTKDHKSGAQKILMKKGEMLSFVQSSVLSKKMVNATFYTSWATGSMHFDHTTIQKFAEYVEKKFNVDVRIVNPKLDSIKIDGSIYFKSLAGLVRSVSKVAMIPAYQSKDRKIVYLGDKQR